MTLTYPMSIDQGIKVNGKTVIKRNKIFGIVSASLILFFGCSDSNDNVIATAAGHRLSIEQVVEILARQNTLPNQQETIKALAEYWIDYTLMGELSLQDSLLTNINLELILQEELDSELVDRYLELAIQFDTMFSEEQLMEEWDKDPPLDSIRAAHILLELPDEATNVQADSLIALASDLKRRLELGEPFFSIARQYSDDIGNASNGGDLGFFLPGMLMPELEEVAYNLQIGQLSEPFFSTSGVHLLRVTDRRAMDFLSSKTAFRQMMIERTASDAYTKFFNDLIQTKDIQISLGSATVVKELARNTDSKLSSAALNRSLVDYSDGDLTVQEGLDFLRPLSGDFLEQIATVPEERLDQLLIDMTQAKILVDLAKADGMESTDEYIAHRDSVFVAFLDMLKVETDAVGLRMITVGSDETYDQALDRVVLQLIRELLAGRNPPSFRLITVNARDQMAWSINDQAVLATLERLSELQGFSTNPLADSITESFSEPTEENLTDSTGVN
jgi:parvulin-like peptidyl-prolyl isomerase